MTVSAHRRHFRDDPAVGHRLRAARARAGISQRQLCVDTPYTAAYVSRIEAGERTPSVSAIRAFSSRLGVSARWVETGDDVVEAVMSRRTAEELLRLFRDGSFDESIWESKPEVVDALERALNGIPAVTSADAR